ncbi:hypothetical protein T484DRAFT_2829020 [Baffinella frigidus]|nr:hypothetical protein T484DRAFT_2829020 [Cryptophyta sp. CCMP2293]
MQARGLAGGQAVEVGVSTGAFSKTLLSAGVLGHLYAVDAWGWGGVEGGGGGDDKGRDVKEYWEVLRLLEPLSCNVTVVRLTSREALQGFADASLDFVYLDGYVHMGLEGHFGGFLRDWARKLRPGGILAGHRYSRSRYPLLFHNVNVFANTLHVPLYSTDACDDPQAYTSWLLEVPLGIPHEEYWPELT